MINVEDIKKGEYIISTNISIVYKGIVNINENHINCAIKQINFDTNKPLDNDIITKGFKRECEIFSKINHDNIVKYYGYAVDEKKKIGYIIMEECKENLLQHLCKDKTITQKKKIEYIKKIAYSIHYLHSNNIIHRDIKLQNILIDYRNEIKVSDFGTAKFISKSNNTFAGSVCYIAPELVLGKKITEPKLLDIYSFGILMWAIFKGNVPFINYKCNQYLLLKKIIINKIKPNLNEIICCDKFKDLMSKCWNNDTKKRPVSFKDIIDVLEDEYGNECANPKYKLTISIPNHSKSNEIYQSNPNKNIFKKIFFGLKRLSPKRKRRRNEFEVK